MGDRSIFATVTTIHGLDKLSHTNKSRRLWTVVIFANLALTIGYLVMISSRYNNDSIITRINANCKINQVPFPAVSICNYNLVSNKRSQIIQNILKSWNISQGDTTLFMQSLPNLIDYRISSEHSFNFTHILRALRHHYFTIETVMEEVHQRCADLLVYCSFNRKAKNCSNMFTLIKTSEGHCCTFNYVALNDEDTEGALGQEDSDVEHYEDTVSDNKQSDIIVTSESGKGSGLVAVFAVEPRDYPPWSLSRSCGAKVLISDPNDYIEHSVLYKHVNLEESLDLKVEPYVFQSDDALRSIPRARRGCVFHDEMDLLHTNRYSTETCATECRMKSYLQNCGCLPYKYPREAATRICEFKDLECLNNFRAKRSPEERCDPVCYLECRDQRFRFTSDVMPLLPDLYPHHLMTGRDSSELSALHVYFDKPTCSCYRQMLLMDFTSFIATYGGVFSLSFGASLVTLLEIIYLILKALTLNIWNIGRYMRN